MNDASGTGLADRIEGGSPHDPAFVHEVLRGLAEAYPEDAGSGAIGPAVLVSTDAALALVRRKLPGWSIEIEGGRRPTGTGAASCESPRFATTTC